MLLVIIIVIGLSTAERTIMRTADAVIEIIIIITIWTRDWLGVYGKKISFLEVYKHYTESNLKQQPKEKKNQKHWDI